MIISWYGEGCFKIQEGDTTILTDPVPSESGLSRPRFKADLVLETLSSFPGESKEWVDSFVVSGAGEYDVRGVSVVGFPLVNESERRFLKTAYLLRAFGVNLCLLGHMTKVPEPAVLERLTDIDVLFLPGGGKPFLDQTVAIKLVRDIEPKIAIPGFFKVGGLKRTAGDVGHFLRGFDHGKQKKEEKFSIKKKDLVDIKGPQIVLLTP
ncbi:MBL fold metallo-hydrolase [Candidatus Wolfebacteria bacterium]|nr:MBL fold metallo-hydrolase [Candidatus Wolfebacteria bacterium]